MDQRFSNEIGEGGKCVLLPVNTDSRVNLGSANRSSNLWTGILVFDVNLFRHTDVTLAEPKIECRIVFIALFPFCSNIIDKDITTVTVTRKDLVTRLTGVT